MFVTFSSLFSFSGVVKAPRLDIPHADKLVHFIFYFVLVYFGVLAVKETYREDFKLRKALVYTVLFAFFYGIIIELIQYGFTENRQGDLWDVLANTIGAIVGMFIVKSLISKDWSLK